MKGYVYVGGVMETRGSEEKEEMQEKPDLSGIPLNLKVKEQPSATNQEKEKRRW